MLVIRITRKKGTFEKGFTPNWTEEVFTISSVKATKLPTYTSKDMLGEPVQWTFYEQEYSGRRKIKYLSSGKVTLTYSICWYHNRS